MNLALFINKENKMKFEIQKCKVTFVLFHWKIEVGEKNLKLLLLFLFYYIHIFLHLVYNLHEKGKYLHRIMNL